MKGTNVRRGPDERLNESRFIDHEEESILPNQNYVNGVTESAAHFELRTAITEAIAN
jgi:hypothetical protein